MVRVWDTETSRCVLEVRGPTNFSSDAAALKCLDFGLHSIESLSVFPVSSAPNCPTILALTRASSHVELFNADTFKLFYEVSAELFEFMYYRLDIFIDFLSPLVYRRNRISGSIVFDGSSEKPFGSG